MWRISHIPQIIIRHMCYTCLCFIAFTAPKIQGWYDYYMFKSSLVHIESSKEARLKQWDLNSKNIANSHETYPWIYRYDNHLSEWVAGVNRQHLEPFFATLGQLYLILIVTFLKFDSNFPKDVFHNLTCWLTCVEQAKVTQFHQNHWQWARNNILHMFPENERTIHTSWIRSWHHPNQLTFQYPTWWHVP